MADRKRDLLLRSIIERNPIALLVLGICSALAVTSQMQTALVMAVCVSAWACADQVGSMSAVKRAASQAGHASTTGSVR